MKGYLIHPVQGHQFSEVEKFVRMIEFCGIDLYVPMRDTRQDEDVIDICRANGAAIREADICFIVWDGRSFGCLFDLGIAYAIGKRVMVLDSPAPVKDSKSWAEFINKFCEGGEMCPKI